MKLASSGNTLEISSLGDRDDARWDEFVDGCDAGTFFHRSGWRHVIERSCRFKPYYLFAHSNGDIHGVLPLFHIRSPLFGNTLTSVPFCVAGGPAGSDEAARVLVDRAMELANEIGVDCLEMRNVNPLEGEWIANDLYASFSREIQADPDENLKAIPRKQRAMVRKGIKAGLQSTVEASPENFYRIYSTSVRNLGTPVFHKMYFKLLQEVFGPSCEITTVLHEGEPVSSVMSFLYKGTVFPYYGGGLPVARTLKAYDFLYWEVMRRAAEQGYTRFDFGRSKRGAGSFAFKKNWGFEPVPLSYQSRLIRGKAVPDRNPMSRKYRTAVAVWKKLPLPVANFIGPFISPYLA